MCMAKIPRRICIGRELSLVAFIPGKKIESFRSLGDFPLD